MLGPDDFPTWLYHASEPAQLFARPEDVPQPVSEWRDRPPTAEGVSFSLEPGASYLHLDDAPVRRPRGRPKKVAE